MKKILVILFLILAFQAVKAHPIGMTYCELRYKAGVLSFSSRIFYFDFNYEFQKSTTVKNKNYVKLGFDKRDLADLREYLKKKVIVKVDNKVLKFNKITYSFEKHADDAYIFNVVLSVNAKIKTGDKMYIYDDILLDWVKGQQHFISVYMKGTDEPTHGIITLDKNHPDYEFVMP
jgi:hypothetical protein